MARALLGALVLAAGGCAGPAPAGEPRGGAATATSATAGARPVASTVAPSTRDPRLAELRRALDRSATFLAASAQGDGQFVYRVHLDPGVNVRPAYNLLRHAGAIYALASYQARWPSAPVEAAIARAARYLRAQVQPLEDRAELSALWESPSRREAKLGGAGLALVAFASAERATPGSGGVSELGPLARFVVFLQKDDGGFYSKYFADERGRSDRWTSLYYPGEAALGLLMLHEVAPDQRHLEAAVRALGYLAERRRGRLHVEPDHWALIATGRLFAEHQGSPWPVEASRLRQHALQVCESILLDEQVRDAGSRVHGAWDESGRTTPVATRLEGLIAALPLVDRAVNADLAERMRAAIDAGIAFLLRAQVREGRFAGAVPRAVERVDERAGEVRIDYVQHAMSAWLGYYELLEAEAPPR
jgi:hypothetical protein